MMTQTVIVYSTRFSFPMYVTFNKDDVTYMNVCKDKLYCEEDCTLNGYIIDYDLRNIYIKRKINKFQ